MHPLIKSSYADDRMAAIPIDILNDGCRIVDGENSPENCENEHEERERSFLSKSLLDNSGDLSGDEISQPLCDLLSDEDRYFFF